MRWSLPWRGAAGFRRGEDGVALMEAVGALTILAVGFVALGAGLTVGFRQIAESRQRQVAAEVATSRLEHLRNVPYENVALATGPTHNPDEGHPDFHVSVDGVTYD
ncbi:MAG: type IV pilus modification PilV family protein, partial [Actinomycetota bacterium]